jgi:hypothetical protein
MLGVASVPEYRIFVVESDSYITQPPQLVECANDQEAIQCAEQFIDGRDRELWEKSRCVARFARTSGK